MAKLDVEFLQKAGNHMDFMGLAKDLSIVFLRIITILPLLLGITLFMGKRAIGELPVFDFLIIVTLGAVVGADIADPAIHHLPTAFAIIMIGILQKVIARWKIANRKIGHWFTLNPTVVIHNGKFLDNNMKKVRYSIDNILQMLREKDVFDVKQVETAVIEPNGALSVLKKPVHRTVTCEDLDVTKSASALSFPVILEGQVYQSVLQQFNLNESWLRTQFAAQGITDLESIFFASINSERALHYSLKDEATVNVPVIEH